MSASAPPYVGRLHGVLAVLPSTRIASVAHAGLMQSFPTDRGQVGALLLGDGHLGQRLFGDVGADLGLDLLRHFWIALEEVAGVVLALTDAVLAIAVPGAGFLDQLVEHTQLDDIAFARNAFAIKYVELGLAE